MKKTNVKALTECAIMVAFSAVLSLISLGKMAYGGSITLASMLPVVIVAYRHGLKWGLGTSCLVSVIQLLTGLESFGWIPKQFTSYLILILFDYVIAFAVFGLAGIWRRKIKKQNLSLLTGAFLASALRYTCHVISGVTIWRDISIPGNAALIYSLGYNATYMIPETIILLLTAAYLGSVIDFKAELPTRMKTLPLSKLDTGLIVASGLAALGGIIADVVIVFTKLQAEDGSFVITGLRNVNWWAVIIVSAICFCVSAMLFLIAYIRQKRSAELL